MSVDTIEFESTIESAEDSLQAYKEIIANEEYQKLDWDDQFKIFEAAFCEVESERDVELFNAIDSTQSFYFRHTEQQMKVFALLYNKNFEIQDVPALYSAFIESKAYQNLPLESKNLIHNGLINSLNKNDMWVDAPKETEKFFDIMVKAIKPEEFGKDEKLFHILENLKLIDNANISHAYKAIIQSDFYCALDDNKKTEITDVISVEFNNSYNHDLTDIFAIVASDGSVHMICPEETVNPDYNTFYRVTSDDLGALGGCQHEFTSENFTKEDEKNLIQRYKRRESFLDNRPEQTARIAFMLRAARDKLRDKISPEVRDMMTTQAKRLAKGNLTADQRWRFKKEMPVIAI